MKKIFSAMFCVCLTAVLVFSCSAAEPNFSDASDIDNWEQVCMLYDLGLITGFEDGTFKPSSYVTRAEAAKIVAIILDADADESGESEFTDMDGHWASSYVRFCTDYGIFSGFADGTFLPEKNITAGELAKILLMAIGCDGSDYVGADWLSAVDTDAEELGLYDGFSGETDTAITRDDACLLIFNALNCYAVETTESGSRVYMTDQLLNPVTVLENRYGVVRYEEYVEANEYADLSETGSHLEDGFTRLYGHREFALSTDLSVLGHQVEIYVIDNTVIGIPCYSSSETSYTFDSLTEMKETLENDEFSLTRNTAYYINYDLATLQELETLEGQEGMTEYTVIDHEGDGKIDLVLAISCESATVLDSRDLTLKLNAGSCAAQNAEDSETEYGENNEPENYDDISTDESDEEEEESQQESEDEAVAVEDDEAETEQESDVGTADDDTAYIITSDEILTPSFRLHTGDQVWVACIGGRYLVMESN